MKARGFTLIELCVVITIVFILSMAGGYQLLQLLDRRVEYKIRAQALHQMALAVKQLRHDSTNGRNPQTEKLLLPPVCFNGKWHAEFKMTEVNSADRTVEIEANIFEPSAQNPSRTIKVVSWTKAF